MFIVSYSEIEQLAARRAHNPKVPGSSPGLATKAYAVIAQLARAPPCQGGGRRFESGLPLTWIEKTPSSMGVFLYKGGG